MINYSKHIWEGWTVQDFIDALDPIFNMIMYQKPFTTRNQIKEWCMDNQPYYKKYIPEVVDHFCEIHNVK